MSTHIAPARNLRSPLVIKYNMTLSVCMIVRDEAQVIARSVNCALSVADEVIVVDTGSADDTRKIALSLGAKVYDFEWTDDFSAARNFSFSLASGDYIMWLDADDVKSETKRS